MQQHAYKIAVLAAVALAIAAVVIAKRADRLQEPPVTPPVASPMVAARLPAIHEYGLGTCTQCKRMKPILESLKAEYQGRAKVEIIDLAENEEAIKEHGISVMPTQIFFDADGNEVSRHEGFYAREELIARLEEMGVE